MRLLTFVLMIGLGLAGCGDKNKGSSGDGGATSDSGTEHDSGTSTPEDSGTGTLDSGNHPGDGDDAGAIADAGESHDSGADSGAAGGIPTPAAGKATINATFSNADGDYNGTSTPYTGVEAMGSTELNGSTYYFKTHDATFRAVVVQIAEKPVKGKTYELTADNTFTLGLISFSEAPNINAAKQFKCFGPVTIDSVSGTSYAFHFSGDCSPNAGTAAGTVKITGEGAGTF